MGESHSSGDSEKEDDMFQRIPVLLAVTAAFIILSGCVAKSDYLLKQAEVDTLNGDLAVLTAQKEDLQETLDGLENSLSELKIENDNLIADKDALAVSLSALQERMNRTIEELRNRNTELDGDKQMLSEGIALLKKSKEKEVKMVSSTYEDLLAEMKGEIEQGQVAITELKGKLTVDVVDRILFDSGQTEVKPEGLAVLKRVVEILMSVTDKVIRVEGHTDNVPIGGILARKYPTNWELSAARALNVTRYLEKEGIDPAILSAAAYGEHQPVAKNDTHEGRAKNRRIAIILLPKE
jgi:chemotaxis protein MotB